MRRQIEDVNISLSKVHLLRSVTAGQRHHLSAKIGTLEVLRHDALSTNGVLGKSKIYSRATRDIISGRKALLKGISRFSIEQSARLLLLLQKWVNRGSLRRHLARSTKDNQDGQCSGRPVAVWKGRKPRAVCLISATSTDTGTRTFNERQSGWPVFWVAGGCLESLKASRGMP